MLSLEDAKIELVNLLSKVSANDLPQLSQFISNYMESTLNQNQENSLNRVNGLKTLRKIAKSLRKKVGINGETSDEKVVYPSDGEFKSSLPNTTVDSFLYDDLDLENLQDKELVCQSRYCNDCHSFNIQDTTYNSHSLSINDVDWIFNELLPKFIDLSNKTLVDIGSRLGVVLYASALFRPKIKLAYGIEINHEFCTIQQETLKFVENADKCKVVEGDFRENLDLIQNADIILMNNVFTFFADPKTQIDCWNVLHKNISAGTLLVHAHSVHQVTNHLTLDFDIDKWLELLYPSDMEILDSENRSDIYLYRVL